MKLLCAAGLVCILVIGCSSQSPQAQSSGESAIRAVEADWLKAAKAKDLSGFVSFYAEDAALMAPNAPVATGAAIQQSLGQLFALPGFSLTFESTKIVVAGSGDLAYTQGRYELTFNDDQGRPATDKGKYVNVFRKQANDAWKVTADIFNSDNPPPK